MFLRRGQLCSNSLDRNYCIVIRASEYHRCGAAYFSILNGEDIADVRFRYDSAMRKYVERHLWDD